MKIGRNKSKEIDFVTQKGKQLEYYQVSYLMPTEETRNREFDSFKGIEDNFPKYVLSIDNVDFSQNGIQHLNIENWLLEK